jgi:hypothetical protein
VHLTGARRAPPLPSPRAPIKRSPQAPPSPHRPQPPPFSPRQAQFREAPPSSSPPVSSPPLFSRPLCWSSERLNQPTSFPSLPRTQHTTFSPQSLAQRPPAAIPTAELRHLPAGSPSRPPLAKSSLPRGSPAPARAKAPPRGPRTGSPVANRRRAHRRPVFFPRGRSVHPRRRPAAPFPPPLSLMSGPHGDAAPPARPRRLPTRGSQLGQRPRARVPLAWLGRNPPPAHLRRNSFSFSFLHPFLI